MTKYEMSDKLHFMKKANTLVEVLIVVAVLGFLAQMTLIGGKNKESDIVTVKKKVDVQSNVIKKQRAITILNQIASTNYASGVEFIANSEDAKKYFSSNMQKVKEDRDSFCDIEGVCYKFECLNNNCKIIVKTAEGEEDITLNIINRNGFLTISE